MGNKPFEFEIKGLARLLKRFDDAPKLLVKELNAEMEVSCDEIANNAAAAAPVDDSNLWKTIIPDKVKDLVFNVEARANYAAYVEFGTGDGADIPTGLETYAQQFYVNGKGHMPARPYLFPAYEAEKVNLIRNIKNILKDL